MVNKNNVRMVMVTKKKMEKENVRKPLEDAFSFKHLSA
jgi:hypothetical protein